MAIVRHYLHHPTFSHFDTIPECDRQTHTQTHYDGIHRPSIASHAKNCRFAVACIHTEMTCKIYYPLYSHYTKCVKVKYEYDTK